MPSKPFVPMVLAAALLATACGGSSGGGSSSSGNLGPTCTPTCREDMRQFVESISAYARGTDPNFLVIPQNGHNLLTEDGLADGTLATAYVAAINGVGREDLFYGYTGDNIATPSDAHDEMIGFMDLALDHGVMPIVIDYVATGSANIATSYTSNDGLGYLSFAATHRDVDNIPTETTYASYYPHNPNTDDVTTLAQAANVLYLLNPCCVGDGDNAAYLSTLQATSYDVLIIDATLPDGTDLSPSDVASLKTKAGGGSRLVIAYMSIGEAENYRYYWQSGWKRGSPAFIGPVNPDWPGNYKVRYWEPEWQAIITGNDTSYTQRLLDAGFDGAYLDIIDAFEFWEE
ncbi:MAG TPA: endo alpha-1,4 polygalactosaminidase [bacterium]